MSKTQAIGQLGEEQAAKYLLQQGYQMLDRNFRVRSGELDIIAKQRDTIVFVEVKTRSSDLYMTAREAVTKAKQTKIRNAARAYLACNTLSYRNVRFDVIEYYTKNNQIEHFVDAF